MGSELCIRDRPNHKYHVRNYNIEVTRHELLGVLKNGARYEPYLHDSHGIGDEYRGLDSFGRHSTNQVVLPTVNPVFWIHYPPSI